MPTRENLFQLIQLLAADERKYFIKTLNKSDNSNPVLLNLFKDLVRADKYQPEKLEKKYKSLRAQMSKLKKELLEAMRVKSLDKDVDNKIFCLLKDFQFYYKKGFLKSATKSLEEAKRLSIAYEKTGTTLQIVREEMRLRMEQSTKELKGTIDELISERNHLLQILTSEEDAMITHYSVFSRLRVDSYDKGKEGIPFPSPDEEPCSFYTRSYRNNANAVYCHLTRDFEGAMKHFRKLVLEWKGQDLVRDERKDLYQKILGNFALLCVAQGAVEEGLQIVKEMEELSSTSFNDMAENFQAIALVRLIWALNADPEINLDKLLEDLDKGFKLYDAKINPARKLSLWYNMFLLCLFKGEIKKARSWMDQILSHKKFKVNRETLFSIRLLGLLLEYDAKEYELLENHHNNTYVLFYRNNLLDDFSGAVLKFIKAALKDFSGDHLDILQELRETLVQLDESGFQSSISGFEAVRRWVSEKIDALIGTST